MARRYFSTGEAQATKQAFLEAAVQGDGDLGSLLVLADWYEEHGKAKEGQRVREEALRYAAEEGRTVTGETWLRWHAAYQLGLIAEGLVRETGFPRFMYRGSYNPADGSLAQDDGSLEAALVRGYLQPLNRGNKRQLRLGSILEALGHQVHYVG